MNKCQECGAATRTPEAVKIGRQVFKAGEATRCERCGNFSGAVARHLAEHGPAAAAAFAHLIGYLRSEAGLASKEVARLLGRTPEAVSRWSSGALPFDAATWATVAAIVIDHTEGRTTTRDRLARTSAAEPKRVETVEVEILKRSAPDLRARQDDQRREVLAAVEAFVNAVSSEKLFTREHVKSLKRANPTPRDPADDARVAMVITETRTVEAALAELGRRLKCDVGDLDLGMIADIYYDELVANAPPEPTLADDLWNRVRAVDARLADAVVRLGRLVEDSDYVRANGAINLAARLGWEAGLEDRAEGETWRDAEKRVTRRYRSVGRATASTEPRRSGRRARSATPPGAK